MKQYQDLMSKILKEGTLKLAARENMPSTLSLFGEQLKFNLSEGFPLITTKKVSFKNIIIELLWFLRGDTNIKFLVDNGCNIWNEDAYNYYKKVLKKYDLRGNTYTFEEFIETIKQGKDLELVSLNSSIYKLGNCGKQYGWLWRNWFNAVGSDTGSKILDNISAFMIKNKPVDQLKELIKGLQNNPMSRRHIITAWNPATLDDMALNACHAFVQFNCRPISDKVKREIYQDEYKKGNKNYKTPQYYLDCQMYQRSADYILGVPYNIASYSLLTEIIAKVCNMIPGNFVHTFGDVHIYDNHIEAAKEQLQREPRKLPNLAFSDWFNNSIKEKHFENNLNEWLNSIQNKDFILEGYNPHSKLQNKTKLSTGL